MSPPGGNDELEGRKTRFVPRNDIVDGDPGKGGGGNRLTQTGSVDPPAAPAAGTIIGRTRLMGLGSSPEAPSPLPAAASPPKESGDAAPKAAAPAAAKTAFIRSDSAPVEPVVGWVVVAHGPGRGNFKPVYVGMNSLGREPAQRICLDFGDEAISRESHAFITYDDELRRYWIQSGSKTNAVQVGDETLAGPKELKGNDVIRIGKTVLRFYPVCSAEFSWTDEGGDA